LFDAVKKYTEYMVKIEQIKREMEQEYLPSLATKLSETTALADTI